MGLTRDYQSSILPTDSAEDPNFSVWWKQAVLAGLAELVDSDAVRQETTQLAEQKACRSNDPHVVALAIVGGARLVYTNDRKLQRDFGDRQLINGPPGRVYSTLKSGNFTRRKRKLLATSSCNRD